MAAGNVDIEEFMQSIPSFVREAERNIRSNNINVLENCELRLSDKVNIIGALTEHCINSGCDDDINRRLLVIYNILVDLPNQCKEACFLRRDYRIECGFSCPTELSGRAGRPRYHIPPESINQLHSIHYNWNIVSTQAGVSYRTLLRRRHEYGLSVAGTTGSRDTYSDISDEHLTDAVRDILAITPSVGETYVIGSLRSRGIHVQRMRVRDAIRSVDPVSRAMRRSCSVVRRVYNVPCPNALWHIDGHHKLIRWRIVVHGGIDGFSRCIVYLKSSTNNRADTVTSLFEEAVQAFGLPSRVRSDFGTENVGVAALMLNHPERGPNRGSMITGRSVHNQRIERLWLEVKKNMVTYYRNIFYYLEQCHALDILAESHLFALHYVFLPRVNQTLTELSQSWNNHPMRTKGNRSPRQLWHSGMCAAVNSRYSAIESAFDDVQDFSNYGVEDGEFIELDTNNDVQVPETTVNLTNDQLEQLRQAVVPLLEDGNHGINLYLAAVAMVTEFSSVNT